LSTSAGFCQSAKSYYYIGEKWNGGKMEEWGNGMMEEWKNGRVYHGGTKNMEMEGWGNGMLRRWPKSRFDGNGKMEFKRKWREHCCL